MDTKVRFNGVWNDLQQFNVRYNGIWNNVRLGFVWRNGGWHQIWPNKLPPPTLTHAYCEWNGSKVIARAQWSNLHQDAEGFRVEVYQGANLVSRDDVGVVTSWVGSVGLEDNKAYTVRVATLRGNGVGDFTSYTFIVPAPVTGFWGRFWYGPVQLYWTESVTSSANKVWIRRTDNAMSGLYDRGNGTGITFGVAGNYGDNVNYYFEAYPETYSMLGSRGQGRPTGTGAIRRRTSPVWFGADFVESQRGTSWRSNVSSYGDWYYYQGYQSGYGTNQGWAWFGYRFQDTLNGVSVSSTTFQGLRSTAEGNHGNNNPGTIYHYVHNYLNQGSTPLNPPPQSLYGGQATCGKPGSGGWITSDLGQYGGIYGNELANGHFGRRGWCIYDPNNSVNNQAVFSNIQYALYHSG